MPLLVQNVVIDAREPAALAAEALGLAPARVLSAEVTRKALDARARRPRWRGSLKVSLDRALEEEILQRGVPGVRPWTARDEERRTGTRPTRAVPWTVRPIVVGAGPAGLFCALRLAEAGARPVLLERGQPTEARIGEVGRFWRGGPLDPESNLLFGEGGAGTFSDGKVYTRRRDGDLGWIFRKLVEAGAHESVLQESYAHIGTDRLRKILPVLRGMLLQLGADVRFGARVAGLLVHQGRCIGVRLATDEEILGGPVVVAAGHSARDTAAMLLRAGAVAEVRPIAIGARIEHPQALVDRALYPGGRGELPAASYRLAHNPPGGRSCFTFCMCPGGLVVPAQHEAATTVVNGMSFSTRRAKWANSAVIAQVGEADYAASGPAAPPEFPALTGVCFQDRIERAAFALTGAYAAPAQRVDDFLAGRASRELPESSFPLGVCAGDLRALLPAAVVDSICGAIRAFDARIPGFASAEGLLIAPETRTTSPIRFLRGPDLHSVGLPGLIPCGEGAGWGGGIISAAHDGLRVAEACIAATPEGAVAGYSR